MKKYSTERIKQIQDSCACKDCFKHGSVYMLKKQIWLKIWPSYYDDMKAIKDEELRHGFLCYKCAQKRLGRKFELNDFDKNAACNDIILYFLSN